MFIKTIKINPNDLSVRIRKKLRKKLRKNPIQAKNR